MWLNPQETAHLVTFTEEIFDGKLHFLCSVWFSDIFRSYRNRPLVYNGLTAFSEVFNNNKKKSRRYLKLILRDWRFWSIGEIVINAHHLPQVVGFSIVTTSKPATQKIEIGQYCFCHSIIPPKNSSSSLP